MLINSNNQIVQNQTSHTWILNEIPFDRHHPCSSASLWLFSLKKNIWGTKFEVKWIMRILCSTNCVMWFCCRLIKSVRKNYLLKNVIWIKSREILSRFVFQKKKCSKKSLGCSLFHVSSFCQKETKIFCVYFSMQISGIVELLLWNKATTTECYSTDFNSNLLIIFSSSSIQSRSTEFTVNISRIGILAKTTIYCNLYRSLLFHWLLATV